MEQKNLVEILFDFSFSEFLTPKIIKFLYILGILGAGIILLSVVVYGFKGGVALGIFALLIVGPILFILLTVFSRIGLEMTIIAFRIAEFTREIAENTKNK